MAIGDGESSPQVGLLSFVSGLTGKDFVRVEEDLGAGFVRLSSSEAERRQAKHDIRSVEDAVIELLRNARDAGAKTIIVASTKDATGMRSVTVIDDGCGIPAAVQEAVFQPRVTSKLDKMVVDEYGVHGRGMALYSISQNVRRAWVPYSESDIGSVFSLEIDTAVLPEKKDQSTFPVVRVRGGERQVVRGPRNILRSLVEFCLKHPKISVYFGSPAEGAATLLSFARSAGSPRPERGSTYPADQMFPREGPWRELREVREAISLQRSLSSHFALEVSHRNAHRIVSGEIAPLRPLLFLAARAEEQKLDPLDELEDFRSRSRGSSSEKSLLRLTDEDRRDLAARFAEAFRHVGDRYFVRQAGDAKVTVGPESVQITIPYLPEE